MMDRRPIIASSRLPCQPAWVPFRFFAKRRQRCLSQADSPIVRRNNLVPQDLQTLLNLAQASRPDAGTATPLEGVQFHPESILTEHGHAMLKNFLERVQ